MVLLWIPINKIISFKRLPINDSYIVWMQRSFFFIRLQALGVPAMSFPSVVLLASIDLSY